MILPLRFLKKLIFLQLLIGVVACGQAWGNYVGIIPYYVQDNGEIFFLFGQDIKSKSLSDFGDDFEEEKESFPEAAARIGNEQTIGLFSSTSNGPVGNIFQIDDKLTIVQNNTHIYFIDVTKKVGDFKGKEAVCSKFMNELEALKKAKKDEFLKKSSVDWVDVRDLIGKKIYDQTIMNGKPAETRYYKLASTRQQVKASIINLLFPSEAQERLSHIISLINNNYDEKKEASKSDEEVEKENRIDLDNGLFQVTKITIDDQVYDVKRALKYKQIDKAFFCKDYIEQGGEQIAEIMYLAQGKFSKVNQVEITFLYNSKWWGGIKKFFLYQDDADDDIWLMSNGKEELQIIEITQEKINKKKALQEFLNTYQTQEFADYYNSWTASVKGLWGKVKAQPVAGPSTTSLTGEIQAILKAFFTILFPQKESRSAADHARAEAEAAAAGQPPVGDPKVKAEDKEEEIKDAGPKTPLDVLKDAMRALKKRVVALATNMGLVKNNLDALKVKLEEVKTP